MRVPGVLLPELNTSLLRCCVDPQFARAMVTIVRGGADSVPLLLENISVDSRTRRQGGIGPPVMVAIARFAH